MRRGFWDDKTISHGLIAAVENDVVRIERGLKGLREVPGDPGHFGISLGKRECDVPLTRVWLAPEKGNLSNKAASCPGFAAEDDSLSLSKDRCKYCKQPKEDHATEPTEEQLFVGQERRLHLRYRRASSPSG